MEIRYPNSKYNKIGYDPKSEFDTIDYNHPRGHFYDFTFSQHEFYHPLEKTKLFYLLKTKPKDFDGFHVDLKSIKTYANYIFIYDQMMIHGFTTYFEYNDNFYCYYPEKHDSLYRKKTFKRKVYKQINSIPLFSCGYRPFIKKLSFQEKLNQVIQPHLSYWYFWVLYFITVFLSIKKLKSMQNL